MWFVTTVVVVVVCVFEVKGHGRLREPPSRASMWRDGFPENPTNYQDNELFCGGFAHQKSLDGKCGICGDPYDGTRDHEAGGTYANGIITRHYAEEQNMLIVIEITAHHKGWFEFRLCPNNSPETVATQECLDSNLLVLVDHFPGKTRYETPVNTPDGLHNITVKLPSGLTCSQCVLQWKYNSGNNWGTDPDTGESCLGCGEQEQFYGCSDISIVPKGHRVPENRERPKYSLINSSTENCFAIGKWQGNNDMNKWCQNNCQGKNCPANYCKCTSKNTNIKQEKEQTTVKTTNTEVVNVTIMSKNCTATGSYKRNSKMNDWCKKNCDAGNCPKTHCECDENSEANDRTKTCRAHRIWRNVKGMDEWCRNNCIHGNNKSCPKYRCKCV